MSEKGSMHLSVKRDYLKDYLEVNEVFAETENPWFEDKLADLLDELWKQLNAEERQVARDRTKVIGGLLK